MSNLNLLRGYFIYTIYITDYIYSLNANCWISSLSLDTYNVQEEGEETPVFELLWGMGEPFDNTKTLSEESEATIQNSSVHEL